MPVLCACVFIYVGSKGDNMVRRNMKFKRAQRVKNQLYSEHADMHDKLCMDDSAWLSLLHASIRQNCSLQWDRQRKCSLQYHKIKSDYDNVIFLLFFLVWIHKTFHFDAVKAMPNLILFRRENWNELPIEHFTIYIYYIYICVWVLLTQMAE